MTFSITQSARGTGVLNPVVAIYTDINPSADASVYTPMVANITSRLPDITQKASTAPEVLGYRRLYTTLGYPGIETAGERMLRIVKDRGFGRYGPLVDSYNMVALENVEGLGCHDVSSLPRDFNLIFRRASGQEVLEKKKKIGQGDLTYGFYQERVFTPLAWLGKKDMDNPSYRVNERTSAMLLTAIGNDATSLEYNIGVCASVFKNLKLSSPEAKMELRVGQFIGDAEDRPMI